MSSRRLQDVFSLTIFSLPRGLQDVFKTSLQDIFKTSWKTENCYGEDVLKTSSRQCLLGSNVYEKVKIIEITESRKPRLNTDNPFGLKRFFSCINIPDKVLA